MMNRSTLAGLLVLALVGAGVFWVRLRPPSPPTRHSPAASAGQPSSTPVSASASDDESLPDATLADATAAVGNVGITLSLSPQPPVAFAPFRVRVSAFAVPASTATGAPRAAVVRMLDIEEGTVVFEMTMPMGDHRYSLVPGPEGWQEAEVVLPLCQSGKRRWYATVEGRIAERLVTARFRLDLAPPT